MPRNGLPAGVKPGAGFRAALKQSEKDEYRRKSRLLWQWYLQDIKQKLRADDSQWKLIEPRLVKVMRLGCEARRRVPGFGVRQGKGTFRWGAYGEPDKALAGTWDYDPTEGKAIVDEITDLLKNGKATDEQIGEKMNALQQAREKARKQLPQARQELRKVLNGPRQEAVLLIMRILD